MYFTSHINIISDKIYTLECITNITPKINKQYSQKVYEVFPNYFSVPSALSLFFSSLSLLTRRIRFSSLIKFKNPPPPPPPLHSPCISPNRSLPSQFQLLPLPLPHPPPFPFLPPRPSHHRHRHHHPTLRLLGLIFVVSSTLPRGRPLLTAAGNGGGCDDGAVSESEAMSSTDPSELRRVFRMFDRNGDGRITRKELGDSLRNLGIYIPDDDLAAMIAKIDANGDGCVDMAEFGALYDSIMADETTTTTNNNGNNGDNDDDDDKSSNGKAGREEEEEDMREAFKVFDQNGDGFITVDELRSVLASLGLKQGRTVEDCRRMIHQVDKDGDGRVDFAEFKQMMRGGGFAALSTGGDN